MVIGSYVRVGKKVRLSVLGVFSKMRILCGEFLGGRAGPFLCQSTEIFYIRKVGIVV